jgi:hypothetical protein
MAVDPCGDLLEKRKLAGIQGAADHRHAVCGERHGERGALL